MEHGQKKQQPRTLAESGNSSPPGKMETGGEDGHVQAFCMGSQTRVKTAKKPLTAKHL